jgi:hypothetical protein
VGNDPSGNGYLRVSEGARSDSPFPDMRKSPYVPKTHGYTTFGITGGVKRQAVLSRSAACSLWISSDDTERASERIPLACTGIKVRATDSRCGLQVRGTWHERRTS